MSATSIETTFKTLLENEKWPLRYMFKFIVPNQDGKVEMVKQLLPPNGVMSYKNTPNLKYVSITCVTNMQSANDIIAVTTQAVSIEGVMAL